MSQPILILPGIGSSGPQHWQSLWQAEHPHFQRVEQRDWDYPVCEEWVDTLEQAVKKSGDQTVLVSHSLACLVVARWAASTHLSISAAMLVAVPNPSGSEFPSEAVGFSSVPTQPFPFRSIVVASSNDPYSKLDFVKACAGQWGSQLINIGDAGHINASSNLGNWPEGFQLLQTLFN